MIQIIPSSVRDPSLLINVIKKKTVVLYRKSADNLFGIFSFIQNKQTCIYYCYLPPDMSSNLQVSKSISFLAQKRNLKVITE